ncbi:hypothetical protein ACSSV4_003174 [Roseovarius sp. MBR-154]|jgi:hypothetical protein
MQANVDRTRTVDAFVDRHFTWPGTLRLHRAALGLDILRAPVNVLLSPILVMARLSGFLCRVLGLHRAGYWLQSRKLLLRTAVAAKIEAAILSDLLRVPLSCDMCLRDRNALSRALLAAPQYRETFRAQGSVAQAESVAARITDAISEYTGTRSAISEMTTALVTLAVGAFVFQALTPGMVSMAPGVAEALTRAAAVAEFPLGASIGGLWYGIFPVGPSAAQITATIIGLLFLGSMVAAFAGTIADPVQVRLGIHRRRLSRLLDTVEAELVGVRDRQFDAREHVFARLFDLSDAAMSLLRAFRG